MPIETISPSAPIRMRPVQVRPAARRGRPGPRGPQPSRPVAAPPRYRGTGVLMSTAPHRPRPITPATTVTLALLAAAITVWLGLVAHFGGMLHAGT
ncbi:MAG: peptigoglycan-binding protein LysM, partial [Mycobacterium sp.]